MNPEPQPAEFDPSEELTRLGDPSQEHFGLSERVYFYLVETAHAIEAFATPAFTIEAVLDLKTKAPAGCVVAFVVHQHEFWIDTHERVKLWAAEADDAGASSGKRWLVFEGEAANSTAWEGLLKAIGRVEHFYVVGAHADKLRLMWTQWLAAQEHLRKERGW